MEFPFYWNEQKTYTINDANYDCNRIIVSWCDGSHHYASLCELIEDCPSIKQLTRPCIVEALNDLQTLWRQSWLAPQKRFLKIGNDGCLEVANPCICNEWDRLVVATDEDNDPGPLSTKVRWSCSEDWLYCIDIEVAGPKTLVWRPSWQNGPFINPDLPSCPDADSAYVKLKKQWGAWVVDYKCEEYDNSPEHLMAFHNGWQWQQNSYHKALRYFAPTFKDWTTLPTGYDDVGVIDWWWYIQWTDAFWPPKWIGVFQVLKPGIYAISFGAYIEAWFDVSNVVNAIRCWLYLADLTRSWEHPNVWDFVEMWDFKYEFAEWIPQYLWDWDNQINRMHPQKFDWDQFFKNGWNGIATDMSWFPFARTYILNFNKPFEIAFRIWVDMRYTDVRWVNPNPSNFNVSISSGKETHEARNAAMCRIDCTRLWDCVVQSRIHEI